jgi:CheY-like chemotaxis protein
MTTVQVAPAVRYSQITSVSESPPHLVVIDPDPAAAAYLRRQLDGFRVTPAATLEEARQVVQRDHPDAVIQNVPPDHHEGGRDAGRSSPAPILPEGVPLLQCSLPVGSWLLARDCFDGWLVKPVESRKLLHTLERHCPPNGKILLADDDGSFVQLVQRLLQAAGQPYTLDWAYSLQEGMAKIAAARPDLMLVDIALAGSDGRLLAHHLRQAHAQPSTIPIVAISSFAPGEDGKRLRSSTFSLTRQDGFSESELLELIVQSTRQIRPRYAPWSNEAGPARDAVPEA